MSLRDCIQRALASGDLDKDSAVKLTEAYDELAQEALRVGPVDEGAIAKRLAEQIKAENALRRRRELLQVAAWDRIKGDIEKGVAAGLDVADAAKLLIENYGEAPYRSVVEVKRAIVGLARATMADVLNRFERSWLTGATPNKADLDNVVREAHGEATGDARAAAMAQAWREAADMLRQRFNAAGGAIGKLDNYFPHSHDATAVWNAGREDWKRFAREHFDRARMLDPLTKQPFTDTGWERQLDRLFDRIVTNGDIDLQPSFQRAGQSIAARHADHRFIAFKSADSWMMYDGQFGRGNAFTAMLGYVDDLARDIALTEVLGPNPASTIKALTDIIRVDRAEKAVQQGGKAKGGINPHDVSDENFLLDLFDLVTGASHAVKGNPKLAAVASNLRNWQTTTKLSGALLSSVNDLSNQAWAREFAGLSGNPLVSAIGDTAKALTGGTRDDALRAGLATERVLTVMQREGQRLQVADGAAWSQWLADRTLTVSGLTAFTRAEREGFGLRFLSDATERRHLDWQALQAEHPRYRATLERYGLNEADWNAVRAINPGPGGIIKPLDVQRAGNREAAERFLGMILMETEFATLQRVERVYAGENLLQLNMVGDRGTVGGEGKRAMMQLKGYTLMVTTLQAIRAGQVAAASGSRAAGGAYFAGWFLSMTLLGGLALQLKEVARGKDPRDMADERFWAEAALQGGGLGILGDFIRAETNRMGGGLPETIVGPALSSVSPVLDLAITTPLQWWNDKDTNPGRQARRILSNNTPVIPFYLRNAYERAIVDRLQEMADPQAKRAFRDQMRKTMKEYEQEWWWRPGESTPARAPDLGAAVGG
jgi:hypothetical protein